MDTIKLVCILLITMFTIIACTDTDYYNEDSIVDNPESDNAYSSNHEHTKDCLDYFNIWVSNNTTCNMLSYTIHEYQMTYEHGMEYEITIVCDNVWFDHYVCY